ncbi:stomatin-like protein 1 [Mizuhopecten yessoensis]|uniref:Stomatin-like protein 1 n=1 Tax=Mizuhopecten yessoensis TaxID=6573 RepID=A0A210QFG6_MIZYE|nr:stomatin-like protein 1 [Mizuhopecten yessoensis]XP_021359442.1 stomatin-like protein 1 [Mizuhopecten yessoensis]OWF47475.1 Stomatin-like protein 1 [Mizuhopecten yessoensis]
MAAKYSRLPTEDSVSLDFSSPFTYGVSDHSTMDNSYYTYGNTSKNKYRSHYTYDGQTDDTRDARIQVEKRSLMSNVCHYFVIALSFLLLIITFPISGWFSFKKVTEFERMVVLRLGRLYGVKGPGTAFVLPLVDQVVKVDIRVKAFNVPPQQLITADRAIIEVGADVQYQIIDVTKSITCIENPIHCLRGLVKASLTNHLLRKESAVIEKQKLLIIASIEEDSNRTASNWGLEITRIQLPPIKLLKPPEAAPKGGAPNFMMPPGLPQTFQQLTSVFMQAAEANQSHGAEGQTVDMAQPEVVTIVPSEDGAVGSSDILSEQAPTPREILLQTNSLLTEAMVRSVRAVYQFKLSGENGGSFYLDLKNGSGHAGEGAPPGGDADAVLSLSVNDMQRMFMDKFKPMQAYMSGRLKVSGDLSAALKLEDVIKQIVKKMKGTQSGVQIV